MQEFELKSNDSSLKSQLEKKSLDIDNYKLQLADLSKEKQKLVDKMQSLIDGHQRETYEHETKRRELEESLEEARSQMAALKLDYDNYKVKAQSALKKHKEQAESVGSSVSHEEHRQVRAELDKASKELAEANDRLNEVGEKARALEKEIETLQQDYAKSLDRNTRLLGELKQRESELKLKSDELSKVQASLREESSEQIRTLKLEIEAISSNYKEKIKQLTAQNCTAIDSLHIQLQESKEEIDKLSKQLNESKSSRQEHGILTVQTQVTSSLNNSNNVTPNINLQSPKADDSFGRLLRRVSSERPDDSSSSTDPAKSSMNKTLEELLSETSFSESLSIDTRQLVSQIEAHKNELNKGRMQLKHLNELLNESELNNQRLTEQISFLKEEIRRYHLFVPSLSLSFLFLFNFSSFLDSNEIRSERNQYLTWNT